MRKLVVGALAVSVAVALAGCQSRTSGSAAATSPPTTASPFTPQSSSAAPTPSPTPPSAAFSGRTTVTDGAGYQWQVAWSASPPPPRVDITHDRPGFASAVWDTSSATVTHTFANPGRSEPAYGPGVLDANLHLGALYPADSAICAHLEAGSYSRGGGKGSATVTAPTAGQFCFTWLDSHYSGYTGMAVIGLPEAEAPAVVAAMGKPTYIVLVNQNGQLKSDSADSCTVAVEDSNKGKRQVVFGSSPGPLTCST